MDKKKLRLVLAHHRARAGAKQREAVGRLRVVFNAAGDYVDSLGALSRTGFFEVSRDDLRALRRWADDIETQVDALETVAEQCDGLACVYCGERDGAMVPIPQESGPQLFAHDFQCTEPESEP